MQIGVEQAILDLATAYSKERVAFEKPIAKFQAVQHNLARLAGETAGYWRQRRRRSIPSLALSHHDAVEPNLHRQKFAPVRLLVPDPALHTRPLVRSGLLLNISCIALRSACGRGAMTLATNRSGRCNWGNASRPLVLMNLAPIGIAVATRRFSNDTTYCV